MNKTNSKNATTNPDRVNSEYDLLLKVSMDVSHLNHIHNLSKEKDYVCGFTYNMVKEAGESGLFIEEQRDIYNISDYILKCLERNNYSLKSVHEVQRYVNNIINKLRSNKPLTNDVWSDDYPFPF